MKKEKHIENKGITGNGTDYTYYKLNSSEKIKAVLAGILIGFIASYIYFNIKILSLIIALVCGYKAIEIYRHMLFKKRNRELRLQFRDLLESLSNSYTVGMTANRAFHTAYEDMKIEHGENAYITQELYLICNAHDLQGFEIKDGVKDFAERSGLDDAINFAGVFEISSELGGDVARIIRETRDMIGEKVEIEMEIQTMVTGQKNQLNVLAVMPFIMVLLTKSFNTGGGESSLTVIVKIIAMVLFIFAYWLGTKIVNIKV